MARPKSYTEEELINVVNDLQNRGIEPKGWRVREVLLKGKTTSFDNDIKRLTEMGILTAFVKHPDATQTLPSTIAVDPAPLPLEIQEAYKLSESALAKSMFELIVRLNEITNAHHEQLTRTRLLGAINEKEQAIEDRTIAETLTIATEERVRAQVSINESLEQQNYELVDKNLDLEQANSDHTQKLKLLEIDFNELKAKLDDSLLLINELTTKNAVLLNEQTVLTTQLEERRLDIEKLELKYSDLDNALDATKEQLVISTTRTESTNKALEKAEQTIEALTRDLSESKTRTEVLKEQNFHLKRENDRLNGLGANARGNIKQDHSDIAAPPLKYS
ncbi:MULTISPECIES: hypothetical protein [Vibrio]|uniref:hypothetical protein n=1 Tax=Vibrio TaxID=662 RepID=UPI0002FBAF6C|nr:MULTISPECIES: hypothetical protein [Vibrio]OED78094.1 hypothetical protein A144_22650 [Vibrio splendidus ZF-90]OEF07100.1 hypothetical protein A1QK_07385 [Vibrio genomosp. F10 str. 9ZD137]OEF21219.1 hypothetical protein A145_05780 [Vibrio splendidus 5S-101]PTO65050.1 hypothetical protein CWN81_22830 [Vibrio splendidus]PTP28194.1 hypothetical protein CWN95_22900 [Vibrio splendidus]